MSEEKQIVKETPTIGDFNGRPTIILNPSSKYPISFGLSKARLYLAQMEHIKNFVESNGQKV